MIFGIHAPDPCFVELGMVMGLRQTICDLSGERMERRLFAE